MNGQRNSPKQICPFNVFNVGGITMGGGGGGGVCVSWSGWGEAGLSDFFLL